MRDGTTLLADVHRPDADGRFPALLAATPHPRQMQHPGAPMLPCRNPLAIPLGEDAV